MGWEKYKNNIASKLLSGHHLFDKKFVKDSKIRFHVGFSISGEKSSAALWRHHRVWDDARGRHMSAREKKDEQKTEQLAGEYAREGRSLEPRKTDFVTATIPGQMLGD